MGVADCANFFHCSVPTANGGLVVHTSLLTLARWTALPRLPQPQQLWPTRGLRTPCLECLPQLLQLRPRDHCSRRARLDHEALVEEAAAVAEAVDMAAAAVAVAAAAALQRAPPPLPPPWLQWTWVQQTLRLLAS